MTGTLWERNAQAARGLPDPALSSGGDEAVFTVLEIGERREIDGTLIPTVYGKSQEVIPIVTGMRADPEWVKASERVRGQEGRDHRRRDDQPGAAVGGRVRVRCMELGISFTHFGYDDSMRGKVMEAFQWAMGAQPIIVSYVGRAGRTCRCIRKVSGRSEGWPGARDMA